MPSKHKKRGRRPTPLADPGLLRPMTSRKRARHVTTLFHKLTRERDEALQRGDATRAQSCERGLRDMGGRTEYQRASQLSTSFHSTSRWVLGHLRNNGWLYGIKTAAGEEGKSNDGKCRRRQRERRTTRLLEVGAINTELLDAAEAVTDDGDASATAPAVGRSKHKIHVRAIDIHSMEERIEEADFLKLPLVSPEDPHQRYDAIVCSMVINCVTTPADRGKMLALLYHQLRPGGLVFLTLPKFCLTKSAFLTHQIFQQMLGPEGGVGFNLVSSKESPRVAFFILERPLLEDFTKRRLNPSFTKAIVRNKGKKFPNQFAVVLNAKDVFQR